MADIELVIKIPEEMYKWVNDVNKIFDDYGTSDFIDLVKNGIPLDKIRSEIERQEKWLMKAGCTIYNVDIAFGAIKAVIAESEGKE